MSLLINIGTVGAEDNEDTGKVEGEGGNGGKGVRRSSSSGGTLKICAPIRPSSLVCGFSELALGVQG